MPGRTKAQFGISSKQLIYYYQFLFCHPTDENVHRPVISVTDSINYLPKNIYETFDEDTTDLCGLTKCLHKFTLFNNLVTESKNEITTWKSVMYVFFTNW